MIKVHPNLPLCWKIICGSDIRIAKKLYLAKYSFYNIRSRWGELDLCDRKSGDSITYDNLCNLVDQFEDQGDNTKQPKIKFISSTA